MNFRPVFLISTLCLLAAAVGRSEVQRFAVLIGEDRGMPNETPLRYASTDAQEMSERLGKAGSFDRDRLYLLANASLDKIQKTLKVVKDRIKLVNASGAHSMVLIYYSGHGSADGLHIQGRVLARSELMGFVDSLQGTLKILILDACESGDFLRLKGGRVLEIPQVVKLDRIEGRGTVVISSSARGELSQESEEYRGALFTHHFLNGLRGLADYDGDRSIRLMEAFEYARISTKREEIFGETSQQNPGFDFDITGEADPVLGRITMQQTQILLAGMPAGPVDIYDGNSMRLDTKVWLTGQDSARFSLAANKYILTYGDKNSTRFLELDLTWRRDAIVKPGDFRKKPKSILYGKGGARVLDLHLHGVEFSMERLAGFHGTGTARIGYVFRDYAGKHTLDFAFGKSRLPESGGVRNDIDLYGVGYSLGLPILRGMRGQVLAGGDIGAYRLVQHVYDNRFAEAPAVQNGSTLDLKRAYYSSMFRLRAPLEIEAYFPMRIWIAATLGTGLIFNRSATTGAWRAKLGFDPAFSLGHQF
ncbi:MAG TPA: caspase family protein [Fibrobacteria bacterium]|nr:caspase family protein [Fibrobacteria bacterium]